MVTPTYNVFLSRSTIAAHDKFLALARNTIFNMAFETQQYVSSLVMNQIKPPNIWWSQDYQTLTCEGHVCSMDHLRSGIQAIIARCWALYDEITGGRRFATKLPEVYQDDLTMDARGYSFLYHGPYTDHPHSFLIYLCSENSPWNIGSLHGNEMSWNIPDLRRLLSLTAEFNKHLAVLCFLCPAVSTRIEEFLASKFTNDGRLRTLCMMINEMVHLSTYHKMTNQTGLDICTPAFYPDALKDIMLEYLAGGLRNCETLLSKYAYGPEASTQYSRCVSYFQFYMVERLIVFIFY
jgi:hypothetical protein